MKGECIQLIEVTIKQWIYLSQRCLLLGFCAVIISVLATIILPCGLTKVKDIYNFRHFISLELSMIYKRFFRLYIQIGTS